MTRLHHCLRRRVKKERCVSVSSVAPRDLFRLVATFQWNAINNAILDFFAPAERTDRCLVVRLEELIAKPRDGLKAIRQHTQIAEHDYFAAFDDGLPVVNEGGKSATPVAVDTVQLWDDVAGVATTLGY